MPDPQLVSCRPQVVVEGRLSQELNICGEKTPEPLLLAAVTSAADAVLPGGVAAIKASWQAGSAVAMKLLHHVWIAWLPRSCTGVAMKRRLV